MTTELQAIVRFRFHDGSVSEFKRLSEQCMEIVRSQDTGTLQYDTFFNADDGPVQLFTPWARLSPRSSSRIRGA